MEENKEILEDEIVEEFQVETGGLVIEEDNSGDEDKATGGIDMLIEETSVEQEGSFTHVDELSAIANDAPPPDLNQVGKRMDTEERWYVLHTFSGYENVAEENLKKVVEKYNLQDRVKEIFIPTEDTIVEKRGKKVIVPTKTMQNYIFIKMIYGDDLWHTITRTRGITGFAGPKGRPLPLSAREVIAMKLERKVNFNVQLEEGDTIQVIDGPLAGQTAQVKSVDAAARSCSVEVNMFGRPTNVSLSFAQVKKI
ncbi:MAG: transcription termination/antitermination protein NusG [Firmicutes bacterium]|nr:transcription termination/antitermination protein NusG [Bacillota bacterium]